MATKRKNETQNAEGRGKKLRLSEEEGGLKPGPSTIPNSPAPQVEHVPRVSSPRSRNNSRIADTRGSEQDNPSQKRRMRKLTPKRPWPIVPTSMSATGPRSARKEGNNLLCISRKTGLGAYMRRCKDVIIKDGYKTLHLSAMGAAIPLLLQLVCALPPILPFAKDEIKTEITTGTCEVEDEILPDDDDEDISVRQRSKSTIMVVLTIGDGKFDGDTSGPLKRTGGFSSKKTHAPSHTKGKGKPAQPTALDVVYAEPDQEDLMDML